jgi:hypothetical protein
MRKSGKPGFRCHPRLGGRATLKTWMPGTRLVLGPAEGRTRVPDPSAGHDAEESGAKRYYDAFFFTNIALMLSNNSILAPCLRMMTLCCSTESELFHAQ